MVTTVSQMLNYIWMQPITRHFGTVVINVLCCGRPDCTKLYAVLHAIGYRRRWEAAEVCTMNTQPVCSTQHTSHQHENLKSHVQLKLLQRKAFSFPGASVLLLTADNLSVNTAASQLQQEVPILCKQSTFFVW
jgi:hypothetical protein